MSLDPFYNRLYERKLLEPLVGKSMLELGNKRNASRIYKPYFESLGYRHISVDWNGRDGALKMDLRQPLNLGTFDMITNIGTTEHVSEQEPVWRNICEAMHLGSVLVSFTPKPGHWLQHGEWYPTSAFFEELALSNGLKIERLYEDREHPFRLICTRMVRVKDVPFKMAGGIFWNEIPR